MDHVLDSGELRERLHTTVWRELEVRSVVDSTNDQLLQDPRPWRCLTSDSQTQGRGRLDRTWTAAPGTSIALSASLPLPADAIRWGWVPLLVGTAVRKALRACTDLDLGLKWPNDVLARRRGDGEWRKVAGILCNATGGEHPTVVVGIGINVHQTADELPVPTATSLAALGEQVSREDIIVEILRGLETIEKAWDTSALDDSYRASCLTIGQEVQVHLAGDEVAAGRAVTIDDMGRLVLNTDQGLVPHAVGDIVHVRPASDAGWRNIRRERERESAIRQASSALFVDALEERLMGFPRTLRRSDIAALSGADLEETRRFWRALGFANARDEDVVFSAADLRALQEIHELIDAGSVDTMTALGLARAVGRSTDRLSMWALQLITDMVGGDAALGVDDNIAHTAATTAVELMDKLEPLFGYVFRRNMAVAISRMIADSEPESHIGVVRTVGFADLVNFTQLVRQMSERELAALVLRFEALASDVVSQNGGAIVKTVGDEVLFSHTSVQGATNIAFDLIDAAAADDLIPRMRVGMASGRVLARLGDVYGNTVNRASRLTGAAKPGKILVDEEVASELADVATVKLVKMDEIELPGIGLTTPWGVRRRRSQ